jgi:molybdate transport system substrate-binding protein
MRGILPVLVLFYILTGVAYAKELTIAVAASVQFTFDELQSAFETDTGIALKKTVGSSGALTAQIEHGAPFDIFMSADTQYPQTLYEKGLAYSRPKIYAYGTLVLWTMGDTDLLNGVGALAGPSVRKVALPSPETAPYGRQAVNVLKHYRIYEQVSDKLVYGESIAQTNQFIVSRASDVGFTAKSVVLAPVMDGKGRWVEVDRAAYEPVAQAVIILKTSGQEDLSAAQTFYDFLSGEKAQKIFRKYGYILPEG